MSDFSTEQKLQLVQQIRSQHTRNKYDMQKRERILYNYPVKDDSVAAKTISSLKVRIIVTVILVGLTISLDVLNINLNSFDMEKVFQMIGENVNVLHY